MRMTNHSLVPLERCSVQIIIESTELRHVIEAVVRVTLAQIRRDEESLNDRLALSETEAAGLLGLQTHQLRDERHRGRIGSSVIVGRRIRYTRQDLLAYLARNRNEPRI